MTDIDPEVFIQVYMDWEYRKVWDHYVLGKLPIATCTCTCTCICCVHDIVYLHM